MQCNFAIHNTYTEYFLNRNQKGDFKMTKKIMSMILSIAMVLSIAVVGISGVSAAVDSDGRYVPSEGVETHRIYLQCLILGRAQNTVQILDGFLVEWI